MGLMPSQNAKGWSGILQGIDEPPAEERTDPHLDATGLRFDDPDPDLVGDAPAGATHPAPPRVPQKKALPRIPTPATQVAAKPEAAPKPAVGLPKTRPTSTPSGRLKLPSPGKASGSAPLAPMVSEDGAPAFSTERLMDKLGDSEPEAPAVAAVKAKSSGVWAEYKEVILSAVGGALLLIAVLAYQRFGKVEPLVIGEVPPADPALAVPAVDPNPVVPAPEPTPAPAPVPEAAPTIVDDTPKRAAVPMISLLSSPSGASVEINGESAGKTPLISPAPPNLLGMRVTMRLEGYKKWSGEVRPNDVGNYSVMARLEPAK